MKRKRKVLIADELLIGSRLAYKHDEFYFVSPAVYELLSDPQVKETVSKQVKVVKLIDLINEIIDEKNNV